MLITVSGVDSAGKSTQIEILRKQLSRSNKKVKIIWSRGGYTNWFEALKKFIRLIFGRKLPEPNRNKKRDQMFKKKYVSRIWFIFGMLDLIRLYAITFRLYQFLGYTVIADRYLWDTYVDFSISLGDMKFEDNLLWKMAVYFSPKTKNSVLLIVDEITAYNRSIEKNEPFFDSLDIRKRRLDLYYELVENNKWVIVIDTKENDKDQTAEIIRKNLYGL